MALKLIDFAKVAGVDVVKFQTSVPELLISKHAIKADYQLASTDPNETQLEMCKKLALPFENFVDLITVISILKSLSTVKKLILFL